MKKAFFFQDAFDPGHLMSNSPDSEQRMRNSLETECILDWGFGSPSRNRTLLLPFDIYLMIGQSNCAGRGYMIESDTADIILGVWLLNAEVRPAYLNKSIRYRALTVGSFASRFISNEVMIKSSPLR